MKKNENWPAENWLTIEAVNYDGDSRKFIVGVRLESDTV